MDLSRRRALVKAVGIGAAALLSPRSIWAQGAAARKPNIILFLVDDMGWMDSTVYGSQYYDTPNMERLARRSMMFTDAYAANPLCSPTRGSIMTGKYPARLGITSAAGHRPPLPPDAPRYPERAAPTRKVLLPESLRHLRPEEYTIAEALRDRGYRTAHLGKWHLGLNPEHWPEEQGFEVSFHGAPDPGPRSYFSPYQFPAGTVTDGPEGEYIADRLTDEALKLVEAHRDEAFFLNLWHYNVHGPWGHKEEITKTYLGREDPRGKQGNPIMASMLKSVDESLGRILDKLEELSIADDTVIIFFSDNGGNVHSNTEADAGRVPKNSRRWQMLEDYKRFAGRLPPTNNSPLRAGKASIFEGGTREPMLVCWPGAVQPGSTCSEVVSSIDLYPTILEMVGAESRPEQIIDGETIVPLLKQTGKLKRDAIFCHFPHSFGQRSPAATYVRKGDWKLIRVYDTSEYFPDERELYNLKQDIGETNNLAERMPEKVKELDALIDKFLEDTGALVPIPNPAYDPATEPVRGWRPTPGCSASVADGALRVESTEVRPFIHTSEVPNVAGDLMVKLRMRATGGRDGRVYWATPEQPSFVPERRVDLKPTYDGEWHEYSGTFSVSSPLTSLRIDPSLSPCQADIDWIRLCRRDGTVLKAWDFED